MSQGFKLKFDQLRENDPTHREKPLQDGGKAYEQFYPEESHARNICFVWQSGKRLFLNYSYLISGEYLPEERTLTLAFTTQTFILKGVNLENLFYEVMNHAVRQIVCADERYNLVGEDEKFVVNDIQIVKNG
ncbi:MAG: hypothetical protein INR73_17965 [Williamsia sp.]|nr:hypothetical protein [Williamsia sp.]